MASKSEYKKVSREYGKVKKSLELRAAEENHEKAKALDKPTPYRKKSTKRGKPRSDHKHEFNRYLIKETDITTGKVRFYIEHRCSRCSLTRREHIPEKEIIENGYRVMADLSEEEVLQKYSDLPIIQSITDSPY